MVVRWRTSMRQPADRKHCERMVALLMKQIDAEALLGIRLVHAIPEPGCFGESGPARERAPPSQNAVLVGRLRAYLAKVAYQVVDRVIIRLHRGPPRGVERRHPGAPAWSPALDLRELNCYLLVSL